MKAFGIAGWSGSGKTTLIERLLPAITARGLRVSVVKHAHHDFDIDQPGKDSWRHRVAGASEVIVTGGQRWALMHELRDGPEPTLDDHLARLADCDLVIVEGYKREPIPKLEVHRRATGKPTLWESDDGIVAVATDEPLSSPRPQFPLNDIDAIADFILTYLGLPDGRPNPSLDPPC